MPKSDFTIALPQTKGTHRVGSFLRDKFDEAGIVLVAQRERRDDFVYDIDGISFTGVHAESQDCAEALMDGCLDAAIVGMNRLVDVACRDEYADTIDDISFSVLGITKTDCDLVLAFSSDRPQMIEDGQLVLSSHPDATRTYFNQLGLAPKIKGKRGGLETAGRSLYGGCPIVDITQTGSSLRKNGYVQAGGNPIFTSTAVIAWHRTTANQALDCLRQKLNVAQQIQSLESVPLLRNQTKAKRLNVA